MTSDHDKMHPTEREGLMMGSERRQLSWFEKIVAALLCKGDLSEEKSAADPCSTGALFRFATFRQRLWFSLGILCAFFSGLLIPLNTVYSGMVAKIYLESTEVVHDQIAFDAVFSVIWFYVFSATALFVLSAVQQYLLVSTTNELVDRLRREYLAAVLRTDATALDASSPGKLSSVLNECAFCKLFPVMEWVKNCTSRSMYRNVYYRYQLVHVVQLEGDAVSPSSWPSLRYDHGTHGKVYLVSNEATNGLCCQCRSYR
ncbi:hypothetical protein PENTCL1PPCAC_16877 [Pristionchus entomophagus]|uniref:ABC transmembrane type-1 domain-containing protein n=1 Tax=Pristionchus entomophagus TaxID=358040 RepID=A0AAV5TKE9_9BILA|nr:hypothetical protein PENTCL1PPCAC_16877 [Pristionchus entomophagus]